jgi:cephalosporin hydroxylase
MYYFLYFLYLHQPVSNLPVSICILQVLYDVKPDIMIESGTATGGSAYLYSDYMQDINPRFRVITMDPTTPTQHRQGKACANLKRNMQCVQAEDTDVWKAHVTALTGSSVDKDVYHQVGNVDMWWVWRYMGIKVYGYGGMEVWRSYACVLLSFIIYFSFS